MCLNTDCGKLAPVCVLASQCLSVLSLDVLYSLPLSKALYISYGILSVLSNIQTYEIFSNLIFKNAAVMC